MKRCLHVVTALLLFSGLAFGQYLKESFKIAHAAGGVRWSQCAFGPDGVPHVIWEEDTDLGHPVYYVKYDGTTASTPFNVTDSMNRRAERPGIHVSSKGVICVAWGEDAGNNIYMRVYDPKQKAWLPVEAVALGYGWDEAHPAVDPAGNIHVFFSDESGGRAYCRSRIGGVWENVYRLSGGYGKQGGVVVAPNGTVWAVWREKQGNGNYKNFYSTRTATTTWTSAQMATSSGGSSSHPHLAVGPNNICVIAWGDIDPVLENGAEVRILKLETGQSREIVIPFYMQHYPRIAIDAFNNIHIACQIGGGDWGDGFRYTNNLGGTWLPFETQAAAWPKLPGISADPFGNIGVCVSSMVFSGAGGADIWVYTSQKIVPKSISAPLNLASSISLKSLRKNPEITYNLSWAANPENNPLYLTGYNVYVNEGSGYRLLASVSSTTTTASFKYTDLSKKRSFALTTVGIAGLETDMAYFQ